MNYIFEIKSILANARQKADAAINSAMVEAYWEIGKRIMEEEQGGENRAAYGKEIIKNLSLELTKEFGKGFTDRNIRNFRQFYLVFPNEEIWKTLSSKLSWSHFQRVLKVSDENARMYYLQEAAQNSWSVRTLDRNISTLYYQRLLSSQIKKEVENEMLQKTKDFQKDTFEFIKNPTVLEFLNLPNNLTYTEQELEKALIGNLQ